MKQPPPPRLAIYSVTLALQQPTESNPSCRRFLFYTGTYILSSIRYFSVIDSITYLHILYRTVYVLQFFSILFVVYHLFCVVVYRAHTVAPPVLLCTDAFMSGFQEIGVPKTPS